MPGIDSSTEIEIRANFAKAIAMLEGAHLSLHEVNATTREERERIATVLRLAAALIEREPRVMATAVRSAY